MEHKRLCPERCQEVELRRNDRDFGVLKLDIFVEFSNFFNDINAILDRHLEVKQHQTHWGQYLFLACSVVDVVQHNFFGLVDCNLTIGTELGVRLRNLNLSELLPQDLQINVLVFGDDDRTLQNPLTHVGQFKTFFL